jgi:hypothetical protein
MNILQIILLSTTTTTTTTTFAIKIKPKLCINCKFFKKDFFNINKYGKCILFPINKKDEYYLVDGNKDKLEREEYYYCSTARRFDCMCGPEGKFYEKK